AHPRKQDFAVPDFYIRGAVTQIETSPYTRQNGYSLSMDQEEEIEFNNGQLSNSNSATLKSVGVDLNMGLINTFEILPGIYSSNSMAVEKRGSSDDLSLSIWKLGAVYTLNENQAEALSSGLRALMEVGAIELFGKLYNLPYWECLAVLGQDTEIEAKARKRYEKLDDEQRASWLAKRLKEGGILAEDAQVFSETGGLSDPLRQAIAQYQVKMGFFGNSLPEFRVFAALYKEKHIRELADKESASDNVGKIVPSEAYAQSEQVQQPPAPPKPAAQKPVNKTAPEKSQENTTEQKANSQKSS
ncbi:MAG: hypothetical protein KDD53_07385, partial [Bdellovibrionales bacterium]|nr:hypothetical protein [Bdellovibrionales bacterium]